MQIECIIKRPGGSEVEIDGIFYRFLPNARGAHVAEVRNRAHAKRLLSMPEGYEAYVPEEDEDEEDETGEQRVPGSPEGGPTLPVGVGAATAATANQSTAPAVPAPKGTPQANASIAAQSQDGQRVDQTTVPVRPEGGSRQPMPSDAPTNGPAENPTNGPTTMGEGGGSEEGGEEETDEERDAHEQAERDAADEAKNRQGDGSEDQDAKLTAAVAVGNDPDASLDALRAAYEVRVGKVPHPRMGEAALRKAITA